MRDFAALYTELDASTSTAAKVEALVRYFGGTRAEDAAWAVYFLAGGRPRQTVPTAILRTAACRAAGIADWLFEECYQAVGDLAETIAHVLPLAHQTHDVGLAEWVEQRLLPLRGQPPDRIGEQLIQWWSELDWAGRFLLTKLIGGGFRVGVSKLLVQRALAQHAGLDAKRVAERMMGYTDAKAVPTAARYQSLLVPLPGSAGEGTDEEEGAAAVRDTGQPYPFFLAHQLDVTPEQFEARLGAAD